MHAYNICDPFQENRPERGFIKILFYLPTDSLMAEDRVLQVSERLQASSLNYDAKHFHFPAIVYCQKVEKIEPKRVATRMSTFTTWKK